MSSPPPPEQEQEGSSKIITCRTLPQLVSTFIDTFVDFSITKGLFLPTTYNNTIRIINPKKKDLKATIIPTPNRLIAIGDLHGDLDKSRQSFRLAGLIDSDDNWVGGTATVVQVGDVLDRGGDEIRILYFLEKIKRQAEMAGGAVVTMNGNHEIMNVDSDFRYVTKAGLDEFKDWADWYCLGNAMKNLCAGLEKQKDIFAGLPLVFPDFNKEISDGIRARIAALRPGGPISTRFLSNNFTVAVIGDSVFVHGGLLPKHVVYGLDRINEEVREWISGVRDRVSSELVRGRNSLVWLRSYSNELAINCDCSMLEHVLATVPGAKRMIMGHTIQENGINGVCKNKAIRIDVGMSRGCGNGLPEVLEINRNSEIRVLTSNPLYQNSVDTNLKQKDGLGLLIPENMPKQVEVRA